MKPSRFQADFDQKMDFWSNYWSLVSVTHQHDLGPVVVGTPIAPRALFRAFV